MHDLIIEILPKIKEVVKVLTKDAECRNDLQQDLVLKCYENEGKIRRLHAETGLKNWLFLVGRNLIVDKKRKVQFTELKFNIVSEEVESKQSDFVKTYEQMRKELSQKSRMWIDAYLKHDMNCAKMGRKMDLDPHYVWTQVDKVIKQWKHLKIYLPQ